MCVCLCVFVGRGGEVGGGVCGSSDSENGVSIQARSYMQQIERQQKTVAKG